MAKKDDIILIISKCFSRQRFTQKEINACKDLSITELIMNHGLNDIQASKVISWCCLQQRFCEPCEEE